MARDTRNNYAVFWRGRYQYEVRGYKVALGCRHETAYIFARDCITRGNVPVYLLDTPSCTQCSSCSEYCRATISKEVRS